VILSGRDGSDLLRTVYSSALFFREIMPPRDAEAHADHLTAAILGNIEQACAAEGK
jgi:hypothetical protein